jgi:transcriptional regulator of acetoin/glycerol metabolism
VTSEEHQENPAVEAGFLRAWEDARADEVAARRAQDDVLRAWVRSSGNVTEVARLCGLSRSQVHRRIR